MVSCFSLGQPDRVGEISHIGSNEDQLKQAAA